MLLQGTPDRQKVTAPAASPEAAQKWTNLADRYPEPDQPVLVKMDDGSINNGHWDAARAGWRHSPFLRWGQPVAWAALPPGSALLSR
jgi:hypothetical protein